MILTLVLFGCRPPGETGERVWTDPAAWAPLALDADPLASHQPADAACPADAWHAQGDGVEVDTGACTYAWLGQPLLGAIPAGAVLEGTLWHLDLTADAPATAHGALLLGDEVVFEVDVPIPSGTQFHEIAVTLDHEVPPGTLIALHLHNHGTNAWTLSALSTSSP